MTLRVALCIICHDRAEPLAAAIASAEGDHFDEILVLDNASSPPLTPHPGTTHLRTDENLGVTGGRNRLTDAASADVLTFIDDDAILRRPTAEVVRAAFTDSPALGALAFLVVRADGTIASHEWPFRGRPKGGARPGPCAYFIGCGYAVRRDAARRAGGYDERFFYSTEEVDLAFALLRDGWSLRFEPGIVVEHRPSPSGRARPATIPALRIRNRIVLARRHLPWPVAAVHVGVWGVRTALEAVRARGLREWWSAGREGCRLPVRRCPLPARALLDAHRAGGRVLW